MIRLVAKLFALGILQSLFLLKREEKLWLQAKELTLINSGCGRKGASASYQQETLR
jgi:hypothetical protein